MTEQDTLRRRIYAVRFAMWELHLYLDTHPNDRDAMKKLEEYQARNDTLTAEYEEKFGTIGGTPQTTDRYSWICEPWPWEKEAN